MDKNALIELINELRHYSTEEEWFEFKDSWYEKDGIGEYISALSNSAALLGRDNAYLIWGIDNQTHNFTDTKFNYKKEEKGESLIHYLARNINPDILFTFKELTIESKRVVVLIVPSAKEVPTSYKEIRYIRIGSSNVKLSHYPRREIELFYILKNGLPTIDEVEAYNQDLEFDKLFGYYQYKGIKLDKRNFEKNLNLRNKEGKYNMLAQLLSDDSRVSIRIALFNGTDKTAPLYSIREFGNTCLLFSLDKVLEYGEILNVNQADERNRVVERKEVPLFDDDAYREAIINAFVHNEWIDGNAPMITVFTDRIEILSRGGISPKQTIEGFFKGESIPVNESLSRIFLQLHLSERTGRGVPQITKIYGEKAFEFNSNSINVTIPFNRLDIYDNKEYINENENQLNETKKRILKEIRNDPNITKEKLAIKLKLSYKTIEKNMTALKKQGYIQRIGSDKSGYWKVMD